MIPGHKEAKGKAVQQVKQQVYGSWWEVLGLGRVSASEESQEMVPKPGTGKATDDGDDVT